jgi:hypothetical protein
MKRFYTELLRWTAIAAILSSCSPPNVRATAIPTPNLKDLTPLPWPTPGPYLGDQVYGIEQSSNKLCVRITTLCPNQGEEMTAELKTSDGQSVAMTTDSVYAGDHQLCLKRESWSSGITATFEAEIGSDSRLTAKVDVQRWMSTEFDTGFEIPVGPPTITDYSIEFGDVVGGTIETAGLTVDVDEANVNVGHQGGIVTYPRLECP